MFITKYFLFSDRVNIEPIDYIVMPAKSLSLLLSSRGKGKAHEKITERDGRLEFDYKGSKCSLACDAKNPQFWNTIDDIFFKEIYGSLDVRGKIVIDIGASIGDTALYFLLNGAGHVYGFEPLEERLMLLKENLANNSIEGKFTLIDSEYRGGDLGRIIEKYNLGGDLVLKVDCEGGEYGLLDESDATLKRFSQLELEYHYGYVNLEKKLKNTFELKVTRPFYLPKHKMCVGYMGGKRRA